MPPELILIGTVHLDPRGYQKLSALLSTIAPDLITLEFSPYGRGFRTKNRRRLSQKLLGLYLRTLAQTRHQSCLPEHRVFPLPIQSLLATINYPFEFLAVRCYAQTHKVPFYCIDVSRISREKIRALKQEAICQKNICRLLTAPDKTLQQTVDMCYKKARRLWNGNMSGGTNGLWNASGDAERELHMGRRIRNLVKHNPHKRLVHVGGWEHMIDHPGAVTLYSVLKDLSPQRLVLADDISPRDP